MSILPRNTAALPSWTPAAVAMTMNAVVVVEVAEEAVGEEVDVEGLGA